MIRITIELEEAGGYTKATVEQKDAVSLDEAVVIFEDALKGCGFSVPTHLDFIEED